MKRKSLLIKRELQVNKCLQKIDKSDLLVSYVFNSSYPDSQFDEDSTSPAWPAIETAYNF